MQPCRRVYTFLGEEGEKLDFSKSQGTEGMFFNAMDLCMIAYVPEMIEAYIRLHKAGYAHSVECWQEGKLVGGLYGVSLGRVFYGESMFSKVSNSSKIAFVHLVQLLRKWDFSIIDCQVKTEHLKSLGAKEIPGYQFNHLLDGHIDGPNRRGKWTRVL